MKKVSTICVVVVLLTVLALPIGAGACQIQYSITVTANDGTGLDATRTFSGTGQTDEKGYFKCELVNSEQTIGNAAIESLELRINSDPEVDIEFGVRANSSATTFSILSDVVTFSPLVNPTASASAGIVLTDRSSAGATITGLFPGGKTHQARYNGSAVFANLLSGFSIPGGTLAEEEAQPLSGSQIINDTLTSIESEFYFTLSASDSASGTSTFEVVPLRPMTVDLNHDGIPNFQDFSIFAAFWQNASCSPPDWCQGSDFDRSGIVDINDLQIFAEFWLWPVADIDMDHAVNFTDYAVFADNWLYQNCAEPDWCEGTDFDHSGSVDILDLARLADYWLMQW